MSMINAGDFPIDPNVVDGTELAARLNRLKDAIYSGLSNTTRPPDITAGGTWVKFTAPSTYTLMVFNGTVDAAVAVGDVTSGTIALPFNTATNYKTGDLIFDTATGTLQSAKHDIAAGGAYNAGDWNPNQVLANNVLNLAGGTMTGPLVLAADAATALQPVTKQQMDALVTTAVAGAGGSFRNKIIGGDFTTNPWQRGVNFPNHSNGYMSADRFRYESINDAAITVLKTVDAPTPAQAGIFTRHCLHVDVTTADATMGAGQYATINQLIEGLNAKDFGFGQPGTRYVTLSFWVKATKTGIYCVSLRNAAANRSYAAEYTVVASNTWEKKVVQIPVDTTGTWLYDHGIGLYVTWALAGGSTFATAANTWVNGNFGYTPNQVNALDSASNDFKLALLQIEAGQIANPVFESRDYGDVVRQCLRYYEKSYPINVYPGTITTEGSWQCVSLNSRDFFNYGWLQFKEEKRFPPITTTFSPGTGAQGNFFNNSISQDQGTAGLADITTTCMRFFCPNSALTSSNAIGAHWVANAEF